MVRSGDLDECHVYSKSWGSSQRKARQRRAFRDDVPQIQALTGHQRPTLRQSADREPHENPLLPGADAPVVTVSENSLVPEKFSVINCSGRKKPIGHFHSSVSSTNCSEANPGWAGTLQIILFPFGCWLSPPNSDSEAISEMNDQC